MAEYNPRPGIHRQERALERLRKSLPWPTDTDPARRRRVPRGSKQYSSDEFGEGRAFDKSSCDTKFWWVPREPSSDSCGRNVEDTRTPPTRRCDNFQGFDNITDQDYPTIERIRESHAKDNEDGCRRGSDASGSTMQAVELDETSLLRRRADVTAENITLNHGGADNMAYENDFDRCQIWGPNTAGPTSNEPSLLANGNDDQVGRRITGTTPPALDCGQDFESEQGEACATEYCTVLANTPKTFRNSSRDSKPGTPVPLVKPPSSSQRKVCCPNWIGQDVSIRVAM